MRTAVTVMMVCLLVAGVASAQKGVANPVGGKAPDRLDCNTAGYYCPCGGTGLGVAIPDCDEFGVTIGPLSPGGTGVIMDVILNVEIYHTWAGDVRLSLLYDVDCDGTPETEGQVLCRLGLDGCGVDGCCGTSADLTGLYGFDGAMDSIEDFAALDPGCYGPDYDSNGLGVFNGLPAGGCFYLFAADGACADTGTIEHWEVCVMTGVTPVEEISWGHVKALYR